DGGEALARPAGGGDVVLLRGELGGAGGDRARHAGEHGEDAPAARARGAARRVDAGVGRAGMNCLEWERLLDQGTPAALPPAAVEHARTCARCARALEHARALERSLAAHFAGEPDPHEAVPLGFADRVLARVQAGEARGVRWLALPAALSWWVRVPAEPTVALAAVMAALLLWQGDRLLVLARAWAPAASLAAARLPELAQATGLGPLGHALAVAFSPQPGADWTQTVAMAI